MNAPAPDREKSGAGCLVLAKRTGRFLFCLRSQSVSSGGTWSLWGGKAEPGETPVQTALREVREETGFVATERPFHIHRLEERRFTYDTFLLPVEDEFCPIRSRESDGHAWLPIENIPCPMHWGLEQLLADRTAVRRVVRAVESLSGRTCVLIPRIPDLPLNDLRSYPAPNEVEAERSQSRELASTSP